MLRSRFAFPGRSSPAFLPALLCAVLAAAAAVQLALPQAAALPESIVAGRVPPMAPIADPLPVVATGRLAARSPFAPSQSAASAAPGIASDPLGGNVIAGVVQSGGRRYAVVQAQGGAVRRVGLGGRIAGWRIAGLGAYAARLVRGGQTMELPYGQQAAFQQGDESEEEVEE